MPVLPSHQIWAKPGGDDLGAILDASRPDLLQGYQGLQQQKQAEQLQKQGPDDEEEVFIPEATVITQQLLVRCVALHGVAWRTHGAHGMMHRGEGFCCASFSCVTHPGDLMI
jgi:hypothetical protein